MAMVMAGAVDKDIYTLSGPTLRSPHSSLSYHTILPIFYLKLVNRYRFFVMSMPERNLSCVNITRMQPLTDHHGPTNSIHLWKMAHALYLELRKLEIETKEVFAIYRDQ
ncbi:hypothetical protein QQ045_001606 [Rhodiola kirilowii]